jgi:glycosyltransferase involved in cell wall biosynthesis
VRVAIDARAATGEFTGIGRYACSLIAALARVAPDLSLLLIVSERAAPMFAKLAPAAELYRTTMEIPRHPLSDLWLHFRLPRVLRERSIQVLFSCGNYLPLFSGGARRVVTLHDMVPFRYPEMDPLKFVIYLRIMFRLAARCADRVVAVSRAAALELESILGLPEANIAVIPNGVAPIFRPLAHREPKRPYLLGVGARIPRKNFAGLIRAHALLRERGFLHDLVLAGPPGMSQPELDQLVKDLGNREYVSFANYPTDEELLVLYNEATAFVYPSYYEGFGIPVLEAMACGTPVACSDCSSMPEVAGDAALTFDPRSPAAIADACQRLLTDSTLRATLVERGQLRAAQYTWDAAATRLAQLFRSLTSATCTCWTWDAAPGIWRCPWRRWGIR